MRCRSVVRIHPPQPNWVPQSGNGVCLIGRVKQVFPAKSGRMTSCLVFPTQYQVRQRQPPRSLSGAERGRTDRCPLALWNRLKRPQGSHEEGRCIGAAGKGLKSHPIYNLKTLYWVIYKYISSGRSLMKSKAEVVKLLVRGQPSRLKPQNHIYVLPTSGNTLIA